MFLFTQVLKPYHFFFDSIPCFVSPFGRSLYIIFIQPWLEIPCFIFYITFHLAYAFIQSDLQ